MIAILRIILVLIISVSICICGIVYCLLCPNRFYLASAIFGRLFGKMAPIFGVQVEIRNQWIYKFPKNCVYVANHQNTYDMVIVSRVVPPRTITVGKKSLLWIPLFGQLFWLSGNILVDRIKSVRSHIVFIQKAIAILKVYNMSIWIFPEGTRNYGKGLLPFKTGAFYAAISAKVPIVPICISNIANNKIKLNRWFNGLIIIEVMEPIATQWYQLNQARFIANHCYNLMNRKINELNQEVMMRENLN